MERDADISTREVYAVESLSLWREEKNRVTERRRGDVLSPNENLDVALVR
jgi:hypothetical protein